MLFDGIEESLGIFQRFRIPCGTGIFAQTVNSEADGIDLFFRIKRVAFVIQFPVDATVLRVVEPVYQIAFGTGSCF